MALTHNQTLSKAKLIPVEMSYLRDGDGFVAYRASLNGVDVLTGVADMDGHRVSGTYGTRTGNHYYEDPEKNYLNVKFDGVSYFHANGDFHRPNDTIYEADGFLFYVTPEVARQVNKDIEFNKNMPTPEEKIRADKKAKLLEQVAILQKQIGEL